MDRFFVFLGRFVRYGAAALLGAIIALSYATEEGPGEVEVVSEEVHGEVVGVLIVENLFLRAELVRIAEIAHARGMLDALMLDLGPIGAAPAGGTK